MDTHLRAYFINIVELDINIITIFYSIYINNNININK